MGGGKVMNSVIEEIVATWGGEGTYTHYTGPVEGGGDRCALKALCLCLSNAILFHQFS